MVAGFHGNSDPIVIAFLIWAAAAAKSNPGRTAGVLAFGAPYTFEFPMLIARTVFGYRSIGGWWGLAGTVKGYDHFGTALCFPARRDAQAA